MSDALRRNAENMRATALRYPESFEELPWGHKVTKVRGKIFLMCSVTDGRFHITAKLPVTARAMLAEHGWAVPTAYGLGKAGWVSGTFEPGESVPEPLFVAWLDESYRAVAPKSLQKLRPDSGPPPARPPMDLSALQNSPFPGGVMFVGADELRLARATETLGAAGHRAGAATLEAGCGAFVVAEEMAAAVVVVDLLKEGAEAIALAVDLAASLDVPLVAAGIKDKKHEANVGETLPTAALLSRKAPGDVGFLRKVSAALA